MNKIQLLILSSLLNNDAVSKLTAMTINDIKNAEKLNYECSTIYKHLKAFCIENYVDIGVKECKAFTFYITKTGIQKLKEEMEDER